VANSSGSSSCWSCFWRSGQRDTDMGPRRQVD